MNLICDIKLNPYIYYTDISLVYKDPKTCCQIVEQKNPATEMSVFFVIVNLRPANLRYTMNTQCKNMSRAAHRHHMAIIYVSFSY